MPRTENFTQVALETVVAAVAVSRRVGSRVMDDLQRLLASWQRTTSAVPRTAGVVTAGDAEARTWARRATERAEAGLARDDSEWARKRIEELRKTLANG